METSYDYSRRCLLYREVPFCGSLLVLLIVGLTLCSAFLIYSAATPECSDTPVEITTAWVLGCVGASISLIVSVALYYSGYIEAWIEGHVWGGPHLATAASNV